MHAHTSSTQWTPGFKKNNMELRGASGEKVWGESGVEGQWGDRPAQSTLYACTTFSNNKQTKWASRASSLDVHSLPPPKKKLGPKSPGGALSHQNPGALIETLLSPCFSELKPFSRPETFASFGCVDQCLPAASTCSHTWKSPPCPARPGDNHGNSAACRPV